MTLWEYVSIREDVFDRSMDENVAPALSDVILGKAHRIYTDPELFISITHVTETIKRIVSEVLNAFASRTGKAIIIPSTFGGGKTHIMILLYHLIRSPNLLTKILGEEAKYRKHILEDVEIIVIDGMDKRLAPSPIEILEENGLKIKTLWGYVAHKLGTYDKIRIYDEKLISPDKATLSEIFNGKKVLLLIDEIGVYYNRLHKSGSQDLSNYSKQVVIFLRMLSEVVKERNLVVILGIPAEPREGGFKAETGYEDFVNQIEREVGRVALVVGKPIVTDEDFVGILRKRLFTKIDLKGVQLARNKLRKLHVDHSSLVKDVSGEIEKYYPFHPLFILTLREIVEKNKNLQKTRDALKIARKVLRNLYQREKSSELLLIMPSDIDLRVEEIRVNIITQDFIGFDLVLNKIINKAKEVPVEEGIKPEVYRDLAYRLALYVLLRTYIYDPHLEPRSEYPSKVEVITGVYDPDRYEQYVISPITVSELLDKLSGGSTEYRMPHLYGRDGYYWVTRLLDIEEQIERESEKVDDIVAKRIIIKEVRDLFTKPYEKAQEFKPTVLDKEPVILLEIKLLEEDVPRYRLGVIVSPLEDVEEGCYSYGDLYELVYYRQSGTQKTMRRYANTLALIISNNKRIWERVVKLAKRIEACERLQKKISEQYGKDEKIAKILREELNSFKGEFIKSLKYNIVAQYYNFIVYPTMKNGVRVVCVEPIRDRAQKTIAELAEEALKEAGKIIEKRHFTFDFLASIVERSLKEEIRWTREVKVGDLINAFYENPEYPMILPSDIKQALISGLKNFVIGVLREGKVYFKTVKNDPRISELRELEDRDIIIPPEKAAEIQIKELSSVEEEIEGDTIIIRYYVAIFGNKEIPVRELKDKYPDEYIKVFINSDIELREERFQRGFIVSVEPQYFELKQDEAPDKLNVKVFVKRIGSFREEVMLRPESGEVTPTSGIPDFDALWIIPVPGEPGEYTYTLRAESAKLAREVGVKLILRKGLLCKSEPAEKILRVIINSDIEASMLIKLLDAVNTGVQGVKVINKCDFKVEFYDEKARELGKSISISLRNVTIDDVIVVVKALSSAFGVMAKILCLSGFDLEIRGEGKVGNIDKLRDVHEIVKQKGISVSYCW